MGPLCFYSKNRDKVTDLGSTIFQLFPDLFKLLHTLLSLIFSNAISWYVQNEGRAQVKYLQLFYILRSSVGIGSSKHRFCRLTNDRRGETGVCETLLGRNQIQRKQCWFQPPREVAPSALALRFNWLSKSMESKANLQEMKQKKNVQASTVRMVSPKSTEHPPIFRQYLPQYRKSPTVLDTLQFTDSIFLSTENPPQYWTPSNLQIVSSLVLKIPHSTENPSM